MVMEDKEMSGKGWEIVGESCETAANGQEMVTK